jgi:ribonuclease D
MQLVSTQQEFANICNKLQNESIIFMDTEFDRRRTYYAKLSIVQVATRDERIIFDMLQIEDSKLLGEILFDKKVIKVFHAPDQDFDIFYNMFKTLPNNIFDTQTAAGVIGMDSVMGYSRLCKAILNIDLDKTMQTANWLKRPLRKELLEYAIKDVDYLIPLHRILSKEIDDRNLWETYHARSQKLLDPKSYKFSPDKLLKRFFLQDKTDKFCETLLNLLIIREECAMSKNLPRSFCATDEELVKLCEILPKNNNDLYRSGMLGRPLMKERYKEKLLNLFNGL